MRRALIAGAGFGLAVAGVELWLGARRLLQFHMASPVSLMVQAALLMIVLGAGLGVLLAFLRRLPGGHAIHLLALAVGWAALEMAVTPGGGTLRVLSLLGPGTGLLGMAAVRWGLRGHARVALVLGLAVVAAAIATPEARARLAAPTTSVDAQPGVAPPTNAPDVVLIVLDTVRADHVSAYGYARETTPTLDAMAREGALFLDATAPANWSLPSHASLFTGLYPSAHGAHLEHRFLDTAAPTLAQVLQAHGYDTRSFTANAWISDALGLTRGFAWSDEAWREGHLGRDFQFIFRLLSRFGFGPDDKGGGAVVGHFEKWLSGRGENAPPAFTFLNFIEAHFPYHQVPRAYLERFSSRPLAELRSISEKLLAEQFGGADVDVETARGPATDMYDAGLRYADHLLHRVVEALRAHGSLDRTVLVVLADHGELLGERGSFGHGRSLLQAELHVPLVVRYPPRVPPKRRLAIPVSTVGVYATVLDLVGIELQAPVQSGSLVPVLDEAPQAGAIFAERYAVLDEGLLGTRQPGPLLRNDRRFRAFREGRWKLIETSESERYLFDLRDDPHELQNLTRPGSDRERHLQRRLEGWRQALGLPALGDEVAQATAPALDPAARARLRALGYVE